MSDQDHSTTAGVRTLDILVIEDEVEIAETLQDALQRIGHRVRVIDDGDAALREIEARGYDLLISDIRLPGTDGLTIFKQVKSRHPQTEVVLMSAYGTIPEAVVALKNDAVDYLAKPFSLDTLLRTVAEVAERARLADLREHPASEREDAIAGDTPVIRELRRRIQAVAATDAPVLITGETGTGKELVARTIHALSKRAARPFVAVNCAAFPETLLEAELFGYERGAFTGAVRKREGRFGAAEGGSLFLDEVGEMSPGAQAKLLRVLEDGSYQPLGTNNSLHADVRPISATNVDLRARIAAGEFREDLFYRLKLFHLHLPPLRERRADLPLLVDHMVRRLGGPPLQFTPRAWSALSHYDYPGNVRELRHALVHAKALARGAVADLNHLPEEIRGTGPAPNDGADDRIQRFSEAQRGFEREYLLRTLRAAAWNRTRAAEMLGISRKTLWKKLRRLGIDSLGEH